MSEAGKKNVIFSFGDLTIPALSDGLFTSTTLPTSETTGIWTAAGAFPRGAAGGSTATLLGTGLVLATGFLSTYNGDPPLPNAYLYNFSTNGYTSTGPMTTSRFEDAATLLPNGQVLVTRGAPLSFVCR